MVTWSPSFLRIWKNLSYMWIFDWTIRAGGCNHRKGGTCHSLKRITIILNCCKTKIDRSLFNDDVDVNLVIVLNSFIIKFLEHRWLWKCLHKNWSTDDLKLECAGLAYSHVLPTKLIVVFLWKTSHLVDRYGLQSYRIQFNVVYLIIRTRSSHFHPEGIISLKYLAVEFNTICVMIIRGRCVGFDGLISVKDCKWFYGYRWGNASVGFIFLRVTSFVAIGWGKLEGVTKR